MYEKLIAELRQHHCDAREDDTQEVCEECAYDVIIADKSVPSGIASVCVCGLMHRAADAIEELTAADVRPVVKAGWKHVKWVVDEEWQDGGYWISRCSNCLIPYNEETPFCPHCGADMREPPKEGEI